MKLRRLLIFAVLSVTGSFGLAAQPSVVQEQTSKLIPKPVPRSPNVASLGKYGDYGVSHFSGIPDISIPIYEVQSGDLKVPISLSYHASGFKMTDVASWVGLGWSLSAGGQISRNIRGQADENSYLYNALNPDPSVCGTYQYLSDVQSGAADGDPDVYSYSFPGGGGKFIKLYGGSFYQIPYTPNKFASVWGGFTVADPGGVLYKYDSVLESSTGSNGGPTAWYLMSMTDPNSDDYIDFNYQGLGQSTMTDVSYTYTVMDQCVAEEGANCPNNTYSPTISSHYTAVDQKGVRTISFEGGSVWFFPTSSNRLDAGQTATKALDRIEVKDKNNVVVKIVKFNYDYFLTANSVKQALKLTSVQFKDATGSVVQEYKFTYHTNTFSWNSTNAYHINARDKWGFFNGATSNTDLVMEQSVMYEEAMIVSYVTIGGATNREVNAAYGKEGVLSRIDFPTGGYTTFDYEPNKYNDGSEKLAGGIRVKEIVSYDGLGGSPIVKKYKYGLNESGYGTPNWAELEYNYQNTFMVWNPFCGTVDVGVQYRTRLYSSNSAYSLDGFDNRPLRYNYVTEYLGDPAGANLGKTVYVYDGGDSPGDVAQVVNNSNKNWRDSHAWKRGKLTSQTVYDQAGNKLSEKTFDYSLFQSTDTQVGIGCHLWNVGTQAQQCAGGASCGGPEHNSSATFWFMKYFQHSGAYLQTSETEKLYENGSTTRLTSKTTSNTLDATTLQLSQSSTSHGIGSLVTVNKYPFELSANASSTGDAQGIYLLNQKNIINQPIETYRYFSSGGNETVVSGQLTTFRKNVNNLQYVVPDKIYLWESSSTGAKTATVVNGTNNGLTVDARYVPAEARIVLTNYDDYGNLLQASRTNDVCTSYKYGYNSTLPIAEVTNAQNSQLHQEAIGEVNVNLLGIPPATSANNSYPFTIDYPGTVALKIVQTSGTNNWVLSYTLTKSGGGIWSGNAITLNVGSCGQYTPVTTGVLAPGAYTMSITVTNTNGVGVNACGVIQYPDYNWSGTLEFFHENFEEGTGNATSSPHTGLSYYNGDYTVTYSLPNGRSYIVEYWYLNSSVWTHISKACTGYGMVLNEGTAIDDVRVYPTDAQMKTYTYHTINGMTSSIDENGVTLIYKYDTFGRLSEVVNEKGGIEKKYTYNYKGPN